MEKLRMLSVNWRRKGNEAATANEYDHFPLFTHRNRACYQLSHSAFDSSRLMDKSLLFSGLELEMTGGID
ncbi:hypothetical protein V6N11_002962 [Hibiscus sabdariffa]|uniref:Uncharacterized protein n=1 Tax=Hibiscus sabdariffa TaxID=183260 RepID=A0ABR2SCG8_9ROSI